MSLHILVALLFCAEKMEHAKDLVVKLNDSPLILLHKEWESANVESIGSTFDNLIEISNGKEYHLIIDLIEASPPEREIRHLIKSRYKNIEPYVKSLSLCVGSNFLIKIAAQFIMPAVLKKKSVKIFTSTEKAISELMVTKN